VFSPSNLSRLIVLEFDAGDESYLNTLSISFKIFQEYSYHSTLKYSYSFHFCIFVMGFLRHIAEASYEMMFLLN